MSGASQRTRSMRIGNALVRIKELEFALSNIKWWTTPINEEYSVKTLRNICGWINVEATRILAVASDAGESK